MGVTGGGTMGYLSFDASVKIHMSGRYTNTKNAKSGNGGLCGYIHHIDRGNDKRDGCEVWHSNQNIDSDMTLQNESYYKDEYGKWVQAKHSSDLLNAVNCRIDYAKRHGARIYDGGKNDTCIVRPILVQLDDMSIQEHGDMWKSDVIECLEDMFGSDNIVGVSFHEDETSSHAHVLFTPVFELSTSHSFKCSISQTKFFKSPSTLASMHRQLRKSLKDKGYAIEQENKPIEEHLAGYVDRNGHWHQQGLTPQELDDLSKRKVRLKMEEIDVKQKKEELEKQARKMRDFEQALANLEDKLKKKKEEMDIKEEGVRTHLAIVNKNARIIEEQKQALQEQTETFANNSNKALNLLFSASQAYEEAIGEQDTDFLEFCKTIKYKNGKTAYDMIKDLRNRHNVKIRQQKQELDRLASLSRNTVDDVLSSISMSKKNGRRPSDFIDLDNKQNENNELDLNF